MIMIIPRALAGGVACYTRQPLFLLNRLGRLLGHARRMRAPSPVGLTLLVLLVATGDLPASARLLTARFSGGCNAYTITVAGDGLTQLNAIVSYNITLTPRSGETLTIVDSFAVVAESDGRFHKTIHGNWKKFEFTLTDKYTLSGSAILTSDLTLLHTLPISFSRQKLNCG
jgi:hypothetical protein